MDVNPDFRGSEEERRRGSEGARERGSEEARERVKRRITNGSKLLGT